MQHEGCVLFRGEMKDKKLEGEGIKISSFGVMYKKYIYFQIFWKFLK